MDLRSEIAARKQRIAELRRQRESQTLVSPPTKINELLTLQVPPGVHISVPEPFVYERATQTDCLVFNSTKSTPPQESNNSLLNSMDSQTPITPKSPEISAEKCENFTHRPLAHVPPPLLTFLDDFCRHLSNNNLKNFRETPKQLETAQIGTNQVELSWLAAISGSGRLAFSPFHPILAAFDASKRRISIVNYLTQHRTEEFTLRSPTKLTDLLFSPHMAQYIFGSGQNGQILMWDLKSMRIQGGRYELLPQMRSPIASSAIVALQRLGSVSLASIDQDGVVKVWAADRLARPIHTFSLETSLRPVLTKLRISALVPTCFEVFSPHEHKFALGFGWKVALVGCLSGHILRLPNSATSTTHADVGKHAAPVTCLALDPEVRSPTRELVEKYVRVVSGGLDWHLRVWKVPVEADLAAKVDRSVKIDFAVASVAFSAPDLALVAAGGENVVQLWHGEHWRPLLTLKTRHPVTHLRFHNEFLAIATANDGLVYKCPQL